MSESNFGCIDCKHEWMISHFIVKGDKCFYKKANELIVCPNCKGENVEFIPKKGLMSISIGKIKSLSPEERRKVLKKRSTEHFHKEIEEKKREMDLSHIKNKNG